MNNKYLYIIIGILAALLAFFAIRSYIQAPYQVPADFVNDEQQGDQPPQTPPENTTPPVTNPPVTTTPCTPSITLLSPNGGGVYQGGQHVTIRWETNSCFRTLYPKVAIDLVAGNADQVVTPEQHIIANNTGSVVWTVPTTQISGYAQDYSGGPFTLRNFNNQTQFRFLIEGYPPMGRSEGPLDYSDSKFTINSSSFSTVLPQYIGSQNWPPVIQNSTTPYSCVLVHAETQDTVQKIINGRTYCVSSTIDGGAGHFGGEYTYTRANGSGTRTAHFALEWPSCGGYGGPGDAQYDQCHSNQTTFFSNLDLLIDSLM